MIMLTCNIILSIKYILYVGGRSEKKRLKKKMALLLERVVVVLNSILHVSVWIILHICFIFFVCFFFVWFYVLLENLFEIATFVMEKIFAISSRSFHYLVIISPGKRTGPFIWTSRRYMVEILPIRPKTLSNQSIIWTNSHFLHPGILCGTFIENGPVDLEKFSTTTTRLVSYICKWEIIIRKVHLSFG